MFIQQLSHILDTVWSVGPVLAHLNNNRTIKDNFYACFTVSETEAYKYKRLFVKIFITRSWRTEVWTQANLLHDLINLYINIVGVTVCFGIYQAITNAQKLLGSLNLCIAIDLRP